jgi:hypothetical protein
MLCATRIRHDAAVFVFDVAAESAMMPPHAATRSARCRRFCRARSRCYAAPRRRAIAAAAAAPPVSARYARGAFVSAAYSAALAAAFDAVAMKPAHQMSRALRCTAPGHAAAATRSLSACRRDARLTPCFAASGLCDFHREIFLLLLLFEALFLRQRWASSSFFSTCFLFFYSDFLFRFLLFSSEFHILPDLLALMSHAASSCLFLFIEYFLH